MKKLALAVALSLFLSMAASAQGGWTQLVGTGNSLYSACQGNINTPNFHGGAEGCAFGAVGDSGGYADLARNRLVFWGGGHGAYGGNELWALNVTAPQSISLLVPQGRVNASSPAPQDFMMCVDVYSDGNPSSRHSYGSMAYDRFHDRVFYWGGSPFPCGGLARDTWILNPVTLAWTKMNPTGACEPRFGGSCWPGSPVMDPPDLGSGFPNAIADWDPVSRLIFLYDGANNFFTYDVATNNYQLLSELGGGNISMYRGYGAIVPVGASRFFYAFGVETVTGLPLAWRIDITTASDPASSLFPWQSFTPIDRVSGLPCGFYGETSPGVALDPTNNTLVIWAGGANVYVFDPTDNKCTTRTFTTNPGDQNRLDIGGTYGRFRYFPALDAFALVNDMGGTLPQQDSWILRLRP